ncbi:sensor histidine kinase [Chromobacterium alticapitis]|uniref:sensor histidine kinase n=1 Tax=Chromobacterium alticapitis TaxID=2073169 RepID=UPI0018ED0EE7|nr:sensor histidine kinase [Chromobacterium alticapitis]
MATAVCILLAILLTGWSLQKLFHEHVDRQMAQMLSWQLDQLTAQLELDAQGQPIIDPAHLSDPRLSRPYAGLYWQIDQLTHGQLPLPGRLRSRSLWDETLRLPTDASTSGQPHVHEIPGPAGQHLMVVERTIRLPGDDRRQWRLMVAGDMATIEEAKSAFYGMLSLGLAVLFGLLILAAWVQVHVGLAPMRGLRQALQAIQSGHTSRLQGRFPQETQPLVADFNTILQRNTELIERARTQAGNQAHAIKTPLAVMRQAAEQTGQSHPEVATFTQLIHEQVDLASRQVHWHLARARAAAAAEIPGHAVEIGPVIQSLLRTMQLVHADRHLSLCWDLENGSLRFAGEIQDLQEMLGNLLDNACKWAHRQVSVKVIKQGRQLVFVIEDDGSGIAPEALESAQRRGVRLDEAVPGSGLGLSIVTELAHLYQGELQLIKSTSGGLQVRLSLPRVTDAGDKEK